MIKYPCIYQTITNITWSETKKNNFKDQGIIPTKLCTHSDDVKMINSKELNKCLGDEKVGLNSVKGGVPLGRASPELSDLVPVIKA